MENIDIRRPEIELAAAVGGVWSLVRFADKTDRKSLAPELEAAIYDGLRETIHETVKLRDIFRHFLNMPDESQTDERLDAAIASIDLILSNFERLFRQWDRRPAQVPARLAKQVKSLTEIVEDLQNLQETLALGRSVTFQAEIAQARSEASR
jgi:hypothetical protein